MVLGGDHLVSEVAFSREIDISEFVLGVDASFGQREVGSTEGLSE